MAQFGYAMERLMNRIGDRPVVWVDVAVSARSNSPVYTPAGATEWNTVLADVAANHPNMQVFHWTDVVASHEDWYDGTGYHYTTNGNTQRAEIIAAAAERLLGSGSGAGAGSPASRPYRMVVRVIPRW
jgi:hypothetical protein